MISSARNIGVALLFISILSLTFSFATTAVFQCTSANSCMSAISVYKADFSIGRSTPSEISEPIYGVKNLATVNQVIQVTSFYALLLAAAILIALEIRELHYLKLIYMRKQR